MITVLAQLSTQVEPEFIGKVVLALIAISALVGGGGIMLGRKSMRISPDPLNIRKEPQYVTKEEFVAMNENLREIYQELRAMQRTLGRLEGSQHSQKNHE